MPCAPSVIQPYGNILTVASFSVAPTGSDLYVGRRIFTADTFREYVYDGTGWIITNEPPQTGNFSISGVTGGTQTIVDSYQRSNGRILFRVTLSLAGTPSALASLAVTSVIALTTVRANQFGVAFVDSGALYPGINTESSGSATSWALYALRSDLTYVAYNAPSLTIPFTFATGDSIQVSGVAQMASRYS